MGRILTPTISFSNLPQLRGALSFGSEYSVQLYLTPRLKAHGL